MARTVTAQSAQSAKPKLGQNFLIDRVAMENIVTALGDISESTVVEIGPGRAALTDLLARKAGRLIAVELDRVLASQLRLRFSRFSHIEIIEGDILKIDLATMLGNHPGPLRDLRPTQRPTARIVGNLPYYITSDILLHLFSHINCIESIVIMIQAEVADRIAAQPGSSEFGLLSATAQMYTDVTKLFTLPPAAFAPPPKVHSSVLRLRTAPKFEQYGVDEKGFVEFLKRVFAQKRKTLANNLREHYTAKAAAAAIAAAKLRPDVRAEAVPIVDMSELYKRLLAAAK